VKLAATVAVSSKKDIEQRKRRPPEEIAFRIIAFQIVR